MKLLTRKVAPYAMLKRALLEKFSSRRNMKIGDATICFILISYLAHIKHIAKRASLNALMDKKRMIFREHLVEAHQTILEQTKVKRKQRTLDEMLKRK